MYAALLQGPFDQTYGGGNAPTQEYVGNFFAGTFQFANQDPQKFTQDFAVYTETVNGMLQDQSNALLVSFHQCTLEFEATQLSAVSPLQVV